MCGILGSTLKSGNFDSALSKIEYRGPNGRQIKKLRDFTLAFVRLAIRDLSELAMQPMGSEDGQVWLVYNGEIYGYEKLKKILLKKGYTFKTSSDTEVILNAYLEYGESFINYIDGMFAIAIYDINRNKLILYRDRIGIKPLYYLCDGNTFTFASEIKAILELHSSKRFERDNTAIYDYFTYRYIPEPKTLYKEIHVLEPAYKLTYDLKERKLVKDKYWTLKVSTHLGTRRKKEDLYEEVRGLIGKSVEEQLVSDVPVGTFLSGGIDSSIVTVEIFKRTKDVQAFSMGFEIPSRIYSNYDETGYAKLLADVYNFPINYGMFDKGKLQRLRKKIKNWYDEPFADNSCYPTFEISKIAKENNVPVILTGDGGDEVFGGYTRYTKFNNDVGDRVSWSLLCDLYTKVLIKYIPKREWQEEFLDAISLFAKEAYALPRGEKKDYIKKLGIGIGYDEYWYYRKYYNEQLPPITRAQYIDFKTYLPSDILTKVDRASMQNSVEARVPLLSKEIVEFSFGLSQEDRCSNGELKGILKEAYKNIVPNEILYKEKKGFSFPGAYWRQDKESRFILWEENWK